MNRGVSLHVGLNRVDPAGYNGWDGALSGCVNDAHAMEGIASSRGIETTVLLDDAATSTALLEHLSTLAGDLGDGDLLVVSYSGHGGQFPDRDGEEDDGQDETWCLFDREVYDDELAQAWAAFAAGVRILVFSDSCHSGTVARGRVYEQIADLPAMKNFRAPRGVRRRGVPTSIQQTILAVHGEEYRAIRARTPRLTRNDIQASVLLISGCQDNQESMDGDQNGLFTENVLRVWANGSWTGDHPSFRDAIAAPMPPTQSPNYYVTGTSFPAFEAQTPFTVESPGASGEPTDPGTALSVRGPVAADRNGSAPTFTVAGPHPYFVLEVAATAELFDDDGHGSERGTDTFYATWADTEVGRFGAGEFTLPTTAWEALRGNERLYYRVGCTSSADAWDDYQTTTSDADAANAPALEITGSSSEPTDPGEPTEPTVETLSISGPMAADRSGDAPTFTVAGPHPYFVLEVAGSAELFDSDGHGSERGTDTFYATWADAEVGRFGAGEFTLPTAAWDALRDNERLYYRVGCTSSADAWDDYEVSISDADATDAPAVELTGTRSRLTSPSR